MRACSEGIGYVWAGTGIPEVSSSAHDLSPVRFF